MLVAGIALDVLLEVLTARAQGIPSIQHLQHALCLSTICDQLSGWLCGQKLLQEPTYALAQRVQG